MNGNILVIGSINVDYTIYTDRLPKLGETITGYGFFVNCGGKGENQACALGKVGCNVRMLGAVGKDNAGDMAIANLTSCGVDCSYVKRVDAPTGSAVITVCGGDNHIILDKGATAHVTPEAVLEAQELLDWADIVVMQYEIPEETVKLAAKMASERGKTVIVNPAPARETDPELYKHVTWLIPNEYEAGLMLGCAPCDKNSAAEMTAKILGLGVKNTLITLGGDGCAYRENGGEVKFNGVYPVNVVDTTAAGDSFIGGFCRKLSVGASVDEAVRYATAVSAITISRQGAATSIPRADEVEEFIKAQAK